MASLLCNARECPGGGEVRGRALGYPDLCRGKSGLWVELTLPHSGASLPHHSHWDRAWKCLGRVGRVDGELPFARRVVKGGCFGSVPPPSQIEGPHGIPGAGGSKVAGRSAWITHPQ